MTRQKIKSSDKRKRVMIAMRPDVHERLRRLAAVENLSMSRVVEQLILEASKRL